MCKARTVFGEEKAGATSWELLFAQLRPYGLGKHDMCDRGDADTGGRSVRRAPSLYDYLFPTWPRLFPRHLGYTCFRLGDVFASSYSGGRSRDT